MWGVLLCVLGAATVRVWAENEVIGKGVWMVESVYECSNPGAYPYELEVQRRKVNRTHDGFSATMKTSEQISISSHGVYMEVCKKVDGGCRLQYTFNEQSFCNFVKQYAEDNFYAILNNAGLENQDCPIPSGEFEIKDYVFNYEELPEDGLLGEFTVTAFLTKAEGERVACVMIDVNFQEQDDGDDDE